MAVSQKPFFGKKGGITFSGGEPTFQARELIPLFRSLKEAGIHICVDTNGSIWNEDVKTLLTLADLVLLDVKEFNNDRHRKLTARSNEQTLKTAAWLEENQNRSGYATCWYKATAISVRISRPWENISKTIR